MKLKRQISLQIRRWRDRKKMGKILSTFAEWQADIAQLPPKEPQGKQLLIIRLDDIGDYILFRNSFSEYKKLKRWKGYKIWFIGNDVWKSIFDTYDKANADEVIWMNRHRYLNDREYRFELWNKLRSVGFETVICPSRTRPLLLDDAIALAAGAPYLIASSNTFEFSAYNEASDKIYTLLYKDDLLDVEFRFNHEFARWTGDEADDNAVLSLPHSAEPSVTSGKVICFVGSSTRSKTWKPTAWIELIKLLQQQGFDPVIAGGKQEINVAQNIASATGATSLAGTTTLEGTIQLLSQSKAVISGDTMAVHVAVSLQKPVVIIANGVNAARFVSYERAGVNNAVTLYPKAYLKYKEKNQVHPFGYYMAVTDDLQTIDPKDVSKTLLSIIDK